MSIQLFVRGGDEGRSVRALEPPGPYSIGRSESSDITVPDSRVSRTHASVEWKANEWHFSDNSFNGSFDSTGRRISNVRIAGDVRLRLGDAKSGPVLHLTPSRNSPPIATGTGSTGMALRGVDRVLIGRGFDCDLKLEGIVVSRHHAELHRTKDGWTITDLDSSNGTFVGGRRVRLYDLRDGDEISVGPNAITFTNEVLGLVENASDEAIVARGISFVTDRGTAILRGVDLKARAGTLIAMVGPTGAGKSTLLKVLTGEIPPTSGSVEVGGVDLYRYYDSVRTRLGYVPQDDIVHQQLTIRQALEFGAELRLPDETGSAERNAKVDEVLDSLGLAEHASKRISMLSGGQRKRVSVALELLTEPSILFLDEPTSGLDPGYERSIMELLRKIADTGRTVLVVTHSVASLDVCDRVVFLGTGGWVAFSGSPDAAIAHFGADDYPKVFKMLELATPPARTVSTQAIEDTRRGTAGPIPYPSTPTNQLRTLVRRQVALLLADRRAVAIMAAAALLPALILTILVGAGALNVDPENASSGARTLLGGMVVTVGVIGAANGLREIVKEAPIYRRERAGGLRRSSYLLSKVIVIGAVTAVQAGIVWTVGSVGKGGATNGNLLGARLEIFLALALVGIVCLMAGLLISALVNNSEKAMAFIPVVFIVLWLFSGTIAELSDKAVLRELAYLSPSNWGTAAIASTADLNSIEGCNAGADPSGRDCDTRWNTGVGTWTWNLLVLGALGAATYLATDWALARKEPLPHLRRAHILAQVRQLRWPPDRQEK